MKELRFRYAILLVWLVALYHAGSLLEPMGMATIIGPLAALIALLLLIVPQLHRMSLARLLVLSAGVLVLAKAWLKYPLSGSGFSATVTETCALAVALFLARRIGQSLDDFRAGIGRAMLSHVNERSLPFFSGQAEMYRELRRARLHRRPLSLMVVSPRRQSIRVSFDRFLKKAAEDLARDYVTARIAEFLSIETKDCDVLTRRDDRFLLLLPETDREQACQAARRLEKAAQEKLGVDLDFGCAVFPDEEITFVGLLERAEANVRNGAEGARAEARPDRRTVGPEPIPDRPRRERPPMPLVPSIVPDSPTPGANGTPSRPRATTGNGTSQP
ncbi:MAG TPA: hypothetical protein VMY42_14270 [Thermoguttaceae bacterium]|nr:hypothetical protein [Thermoguttaceae bacterium]